ncbi:hypothetical protein C0993_009565 [Termitomyces sp. T159_Od127]|nr:hypothetical protein C0993_009565 [Termitomyces sp. T159_Od127]
MAARSGIWRRAGRGWNSAPAIKGVMAGRGRLRPSSARHSMSDDGIEYIGTSLPLNNQIVTGLILRVDKSADDPACILTFRRAISNVVHIGRRPSNGLLRSDSNSAMFRCAVVSRRHAKITFSDSGHVYLIDMKSHHGTHVRKPNEAVSRMLAPETPTRLSDGDIITFGKSVGRYNEYVRPIVVRAELIYGAQESTFKSVTPAKQVAHVDPSDSSPSRSSSGRYGIFSQASSPSDNNSSSMSEDSEIEEISPSIPASGPNALPLQPRLPRKPEPESSHFGRAIEALKRFLPPAHTSSTEQITLPQIRPAVYTPSPDREQSPNLGFGVVDSYEPLYGPRSPDWPRSPRWSPPPVDRNRPQSPVFDFSYCQHIPARESRQDEPRFEDASTRSHSPMDLASPSPVTPLRNLVDFDQPAPEEPSVIGAWPASRSSSPFSPASSGSSPNSLESPSEFSRTKRKYKVRFNNNVHHISDKLSSLDERISDVHAQYMMLVDRVDSAVDVDIPDLQTQLDALREQIEASTAPINPDISIEPLQNRADDVESSISALHTLVADMRVLHERTAEQMDTELRLVREARDAALAQIAAHVEAQAQVRIPPDRRAERRSEYPQTARPSLKRKRSDDACDADCAVGENNSERLDSCNEDNGAGSGDAMMADLAVPPASFALCCHNRNPRLPPSKRARRIAAIAAQTATAVTVGAIATWSALAFS